jgi:hypothetical protein
VIGLQHHVELDLVLGLTQATFLFIGIGPSHLECVPQSTNFKISPLREKERALVVRDITDGQLLHFAGEPFNPELKGKKSLVRIDENLHKLTAYILQFGCWDSSGI